MKGLASPKKTHSLKFLHYLINNDFIAKDGTEYSAEETLQAYASRIDQASAKYCREASRRRLNAVDRLGEILSRPIDQASVIDFDPVKLESDQWIIKERLTATREAFRFIA